MIFKRGKRGFYWYEFVWNGERIRESTRQTNNKIARDMESAHRTSLAKGEVGIRERKPVPTLKDFSQRFIDAIQVRCAAKPATVQFYAAKLNRLLEFEPFSSAPLDKIDEALIETYVQQRSRKVSPSLPDAQKKEARKLAPASINRELATLRRLLRLAQEWRVIERVPRIRLLPGERNREFVLSHKQEALYLEMAPQPLKDVATLLVQTGLRVGEALALEWADVRLEPANGARYGHLRVRDVKSKNARRNVSLTATAGVLLAQRRRGAISPRVFDNDAGNGPLSIFTLDDQHSRLRETLRLPKDFVIHSLRHTMLTRLGEAGADAFNIMRIAGHSSVTVSQRYVHPSPEALERAFERLEALNGKAAKALPEGSEMPVPTNSTTSREAAERLPS